VHYGKENEVSYNVLVFGLGIAGCEQRWLKGGGSLQGLTIEVLETIDSEPLKEKGS
jgi:hypothetical protein